MSWRGWGGRLYWKKSVQSTKLKSRYRRFDIQIETPPSCLAVSLSAAIAKCFRIMNTRSTPWNGERVMDWVEKTSSTLNTTRWWRMGPWADMMIEQNTESVPTTELQDHTYPELNSNESKDHDNDQTLLRSLGEVKFRWESLVKIDNTIKINKFRGKEGWRVNKDQKHTHLFVALEVVLEKSLIGKVFRSNDAHQGQVTVDLTEVQHLNNNFTHWKIR